MTDKKRDNTRHWKDNEQFFFSRGCKQRLNSLRETIKLQNNKVFNAAMFLSKGTCQWNSLYLSYDFAGGIFNISQNTYHLARYLYSYLTTSCHGNQNPVAKVYCNTGFPSMETQGAIVAFNLLKADGSYIGYAKVN